MCATTIYHNQMPYKTDKDENKFTDPSEFPSNPFSQAGIVTDRKSYGDQRSQRWS